jgi:type II secretory pathway component PulC
MPSIGVRVLNYALFGVCCFQTAEIANDVIADSLRPSATSSMAVDALPPAGPSDWSEHVEILDRNLFGAQLSGGEPIVVEEIAEDVEETKLPLRLDATIAADGKSSRAAIYDTKARKSHVLRPGDSIDGHAQVTIDRIERGRVLLLNRGRREELILVETSEALGRPAPRASTDRRNRRTSSSTRARRSEQSSQEAQEKRIAARKRAAELRKQQADDPERTAILEDIRDRVTSGEIDFDQLAEEMRILNEEPE